MVKTKQQKSKPKKPANIKKKGKQTDSSQFRAQLDALGLKIIQVTPDGNCFFRALADQLEGDEEEHGKYRELTVQYIMKNREMFEPFIEDEVPFEEYCESMSKDGTWAGHMELQAASLVTRCNICIHRNMSPRWYIRNFGDNGTRMVHLSYHDEEHYNSVRVKEDTCSGPARPIIIKVDADLSESSRQAKTAAGKAKGRAGDNINNPGSIKMVMSGSGCDNYEKVEQVLVEVGADVDAAIEFLIAEQGVEESFAENDLFPPQPDASQVKTIGDEGNRKQRKEKEKSLEKAYSQDPYSKSIKQNCDESRSEPDVKIPRNKVCPCGSKKKYKSCCGSVTGRASTKFLVYFIFAVDRMKSPTSVAMH